MASASSVVSALRSPKALAVGFAASGVLHLVAPKVYETIVPRWIPRRRLAVYVSGVGELVCAAGLVLEAPWAGPASAGLLVAVWPANIQMAIDARSGPSRAKEAALWLRVPLQLPMIRSALCSGRRA